MEGFSSPCLIKRRRPNQQIRHVWFLFGRTRTSLSEHSSKSLSRRELSDCQSNNSPINRLTGSACTLKTILVERGDQERAMRKSARKEILDVFSNAGKVKKPAVSNLFTDVYDEMPWNLQEQKGKLEELMKKVSIAL
ncbi:hypothetical protein BC830DRAFT_429943 [Chytriomyces sp. MP71]|nr:hypothetical protein BC830DRAFT_429943 [Chytriomyces sp. MP71]